MRGWTNQTFSHQPQEMGVRRIAQKPYSTTSPAMPLRGDSPQPAFLSVQTGEVSQTASVFLMHVHNLSFEI